MPPESCTNPPCGDLSRPTLAAAREIAELNRSTATPLEGHNKENKSDKRLPLPRSSRKVSAWPDMSGRLEGPATYSPSGERQYTLKFVLTGSSGVGKTQLASRIIRGEFDERSLPTVGMEFGTRSLRYAEHSSVRAQVWDAAGKFPLKSITEPFFAGAVGAMLVYDISRRSTFDDIVRWLALIRQNCHQSISLILVGNKSDMSSKQREVSMMEGIRFARKYGLNFVETSALRDHNVEVAARQLVMSVARYLPYERSPWSAKTPSYALPAGWVRVVVSPDGEEDENDSGRSRPNAPMPPLPPPPSQRPSLKAGNGYIVGSVVSNGSYSSSKASNNATAVPSGSYSSSRASNGNEHAMGSMVRSGSFSSRRDSDGNGTVMGSLRRTGSYSSRRDSTCSMVGGCYKEAGNGNANGHIVCSVVPNGCYSGSKASNACEKGIGRTMGTAVRSDGSYDSKSADGHAVALFATKGSCSQGGNGNTNGYTVDSPYGSYGKAAEGNASVSGRTIGTVLRANGSYDSKTANGRTMSSFVPNSSYSKAGNGNANDDMVGAVMPTGGYSIVLYENTWTGDRYSQRPPFPAGPAEACVESQVPRAIDPLVLLEDPVKSDGGAREGRRESLKSFARRQSWSFSSLKSKGFAAASECLSRCMET